LGVPDWRDRHTLGFLLFIPSFVPPNNHSKYLTGLREETAGFILIGRESVLTSSSQDQSRNSAPQPTNQYTTGFDKLSRETSSIRYT